MKVKVYEGGYLPTRAHFDDAGIDLYTPVSFTLAVKQSKVIDLKVAFQIPVGYFGKIESKSGLNVNYNIQSLGGVIDSGFRGTIKIRIENNGTEIYHFEKGDKIVQIVMIPVGLFDIEQVDELNESASGRNKNGWGSTGRK